ncbi:MAG: inositol monophosphatase [Chloroflexota bacterium]
MSTFNAAESFTGPIIRLHNKIRDAVVEACETVALEELSTIAHDDQGDTIYAVDRVSEELLVEYFEQEIAKFTPIILIAEGLDENGIVLPRNTPRELAKWRIIVDPIDGTRGLMYQKRSAWILTGVAPNLGEGTNLQDIVLAVQTEIPLVKQHLSDQIWAIRGNGVQARRWNRLTAHATELKFRPSQADSIAHGFASVARFFPGVREELAAIDEEIIFGALGPVKQGKTHCFEDQYISTGGQLYELMAGHDRFVADIRPVMEKVLADRGLSLGICCHPYDICTELIAREVGVEITDINGESIRCPLDLESEVSWIGYANQKIKHQIQPLLIDSLSKRELM